MFSRFFPARDRARVRRDVTHRRGLACERLEPRVALATFAEVEPNTISEGPKGYYQNLFGAETAELTARLGDEQDNDSYQLNVIRGSVVRIHFDTEPGLSLSYQVTGLGINGVTSDPSWGPLPHGATEFQFGPSGGATPKPLPDAVFTATQTGRLLLTVQGGSQGTYQGVHYGSVVGGYGVRITGLDPHGDGRIVVNGTSRRRIEASWSNSTPRKLPIEMFYARGETLDTIVGKSLFGKKKLTIPITTKLPGPFEFGGGGLVLPKGKRPRGVTHVLVVVNRTHVVPETDFTNNVVAVPLARLSG